MNTRNIRRLSQLLFFGLFVHLVGKTSYPLTSKIPVDLFTRVDPLVAGAAMLASRAIIHSTLVSLVVLAMTLLLGRVFCGWICPMGTTLDISDRLFFRGKRKKDAPNPRNWKYYILAGLLVTSLFTVQAVYLLDPLCLLTRTIVLVFVGPAQFAVRSLFQVFYGWSGSSIGPVSSAGMWLSGVMGNWPIMNGPQYYYREAMLVLAVFAVIVGLNSLTRRFWCRNLCPLGALLGLFAQVPILKRVVSSGCTDCGKCVRGCNMGAIPKAPRLTRSPECIECFDCVADCPPKAIRFGLKPKPEFHPETKFDPARRRVLQGAGVGLAFVAMATVDPGRKRALSDTAPTKLSSQDLLRPPGSVPENEFINRCVRCGACMKACPTNGLQPAIHEAGIEGFWTPVLVPRIGCCTQECNACGQVCPTDAIEPFKIEDKPHIFIGTAGIDRSQCIAWARGKKCLVCDEYCSYKAIEWKDVPGEGRRPQVNEDKCVGCGICESACPIQPVAAIRVSSRGDRREANRQGSGSESQ